MSRTTTPHPRLDAGDLFRLLRLMYPANAYALLPEARDGAGFSAQRAADAIMMGLWPSRGLQLEGFEIKVSRYDWERERRKPAKAEGWFSYCDHWWLVVHDAAIVHDGELPVPWGLLAVEWKGAKPRLRVVKRAPTLRPRALNRSRIAALLKRALQVGEEPGKEQLEKVRKTAFDDGRNSARYDIERLNELRARVLAFEQVSGVKIDEWRPAAEIGNAVRLVLDNKHVPGGTHLRRLREDLTRSVSAIDEVLATGTAP